MMDIEKLRTMLGAMSIQRNHLCDALDVHYEDGHFVEVDSMTAYRWGHGGMTDDELRDVCGRAVRQMPSYNNTGPTEDWESLGIVGRRTQGCPPLDMPTVEDVDHAAKIYAASLGLRIEGDFAGRSLYFLDGKVRKSITRNERIYSLVRPGEVLDAARRHMLHIAQKFGPGRVWFASKPMLIDDNGSYFIVRDRVLMRTYYGHEAQAVVDEPAPKTIEQMAAEIYEKGAPCVVPSPRPLNFSHSIQRREMTEKTFSAWCRDQRRDYPYKKPEWINEACSAEWSRRLRELQAEAREKERCQVVIDNSWWED